MSLMRARKKFEAHLRTGMWIILIIFTVGIFFFYGAYTLGPGKTRAPLSGAPNVLATVNGKPITREMFERKFIEYARMSAFPVSIQTIEALRSLALEEAIGDILMQQAAKQMGIKITEGQVEQQIRQQVDRTMEEKKRRNRPVTPEVRAAVEQSIRAQKDSIRSQLLSAAVYARVTGNVKVTDEDLLASYDEAQVRHILVAFLPGGDEKKKRTDAEARKKAEDLLSKIRAGADFAALAKKESDDAVSAAKGGDLGWVVRGKSVKEFDDAIFSAEIGKVVGPVKTDYGYHIIRVTQRRRNVPKDFQQKKEQIRATLHQDRVSKAWHEFASKLRNSAKVKITDPEMLAARAVQEGKTEQAIALFRQAENYAASLGPDVHGGILYTLGNLLSQQKKWEEAAKAYEQAVDVAGGSRAALYTSLAETYVKLGRKKDALEYAQAAIDEAPTEEPVSRRVEAIYAQIGRKDLAEKEKKRRAQVEQQLREEAPAQPSAATGQ